MTSKGHVILSHYQKSCINFIFLNTVKTEQLQNKIWNDLCIIDICVKFI